MDFALDLDMLNRHVNLHQAWEEHGGDMMSKFAIDKEEDEDSDWDEDDNNYYKNKLTSLCSFCQCVIQSDGRCVVPLSNGAGSQ
jgi:hypothetical protein